MKILKKRGFLKVFLFFILMSVLFVSIPSVSAQKPAVVTIETIPGTDVEIGENMATPPRDIDNIKFEKTFTPFPDCQLIDTTSPPTVGLPFAAAIKRGKFRINVNIAACVPSDAPPFGVRVTYRIEYADKVDKGEFSGMLGPGIVLTKELKIHTSKSKVGWYPLYMDFKIFDAATGTLLRHQTMAHRIYITVDPPQGNIRNILYYPTNFTDVNSFPDGPKERWLEVATEWARGAETKEEAIEKMNEKEYTNPFGWIYGYYPGPAREENWERMIDPSKYTFPLGQIRTDCHLFANVLENLAHVVGIFTPVYDTYPRILLTRDPVTALLVPVIEPALVPFLTDTRPALENRGRNAANEDLVGPGRWNRWLFGNHAFVRWRGKFYDPTFGLIRKSREEAVYASDFGPTPSGARLYRVRETGTNVFVTNYGNVNLWGWSEVVYKNPHLNVPSSTGANVTRIISSYGIDSDNDGLYNYLNVTFEVNVTELNNYSITTILMHDNTTIVFGDLNLILPSRRTAAIHNIISLPVGIHNISSYFDSGAIRMAGFNGNYSVYVIVNKNATQTFAGGFNISSYNATQFQGLSLDVINVTDYGLDTNGNGKFDYLIIKLNLSVSRNASFNIGATLQSSNDEMDMLAENNSNLTPGNKTILLKFRGSEIWQLRTNGPYNTNIFIADENYIGIVLYNTSAYLFSQFEQPPVTFTGDFSDYGFDKDADGLFDALIVRVGVNMTIATSAENYTISGTLDSNGSGIAFADNVTLIPFGNSTILLQFNGMDIFEKGKNGPYNLTSLRIFDSDENLSDFLEDAYTTLSYSYTQFVPGGRIKGTIKDSVGNVVPDATITVAGPSINAIFSDFSGQYYVDRLEGGSYDISVWPPPGFGLGFNSTTVYITSNETKIINFTLDGILPDVFPPIILLISPLQNAIVNVSNNITVIYTVNDIHGNITMCSLFINNASVQNDSSVEEEVSQNFTQFLANGIYNWSISCTDSSTNANTGFSETRILTVNVTPTIVTCTDTDGDGYNLTNGFCGQVDCNDNNPSINLGAAEICSDNIDNNCDSFIDEGCPSLIPQCNSALTAKTLLIENLQCNNTGLFIGADNIELNCQGYKIIGRNPVTGAQGLGSGINITGKNNVTIKNCKIENFVRGIQLSGNDSAIINNTFINDIIGIMINSFNNTIRNNNFSRNAVGILENGSYNILEGNSIELADFSITGIAVSGRYNLIKNNSVRNSSIFSSGIGISGEHNTIVENTVQDSLIDGIRILSVNNYIASNKVSRSHHGISIQASSNIIKNNSLFENTQYPSSSGIYLYVVENNILDGNNIRNNPTGIHLVQSHNNTLANNVIDMNRDGIFATQNSRNNTFINNLAKNNTIGMSILFNSYNNTVLFNTIINSKNYGLLLEDVNDTLVFSNNFSNNNISIKLTSSNNNIIITNNILNSTLGIWLDPSFDNLIYNNFFDNVLNARDDGVNSWNITKTSGTNIVSGGFLGGNFWHDYNGQDINSDGLGDTLLPYTSLGSIKNNGDFLPLVVGACVSPPPHMFGWWSADGNANDILGMSNGTLKNGASFVLGKVGQAFNFDGVNDHVDIPDNSRLQPNTGSFTIDFWTKPSSITTSARLIWKNDGDTPPHKGYFVMLSEGRYRFELGDGSTSQGINSLTSAIPGKWDHIAVIRDKATGKIALYVNGVKEAEAIDPTNNVTYSVNLSFGGRPQIATEFYHGSIDEVEIFNRALSEKEILSIFNADTGGKCKIGWADTDNDGIYDITDNCPDIKNPNQEDSDNDWIGDICDEPLFLRGDSNIDGKVDLSDAVNTLNWLFLGTGSNICQDASDSNDDGTVDISDASNTLNFLFLGTGKIPEPYPSKGVDPTQDNLNCSQYPASQAGGAGGGGSVKEIIEAIDKSTQDQQTKDNIKNALNIVPKGTLSVSLSPTGAYFYLDGKYKGYTSSTPIIIKDLYEGPYTVKLTKYNYETYQTKVNILPGQTTTIKTTLSSPSLSPIYYSPTPTPSPSPSL